MVHKHSVLGAIVLVALVVGNPASGEDGDEADEAKKDDCFQIRRIDSWSPIDNNHILVRASRDEQYLLTLRSSCRGISRARGLALSNYMGRLCPDDFGRVTFRSAGMNERCRIENVERVKDKDEAEAVVESRKSEE